MIPVPEHLTEIFTFENLLSAFKKASKNKRKKKDVSLFRENLYGNLLRIERMFKHGKYPEIKYHSFIVEQPKRRVVWATTFEVRVIMHCFCDEFLTEFFEPLYSDRNCACRTGKGTEYAAKCLKQDLVEYYKANGNEGYILKADIHHYFQSIDHDVLKGMLNKVLPDGEVKDFLFYIIDSFPEGLPLGNQTSQLLALFYLSPVDKYIQSQLPYYVRYMDDFVAISNNKETLIHVLNQVTDVVENQLCLKLNPKTSIQTLKNGVGFLGWSYEVKNTGKIVKRRMKSKKAIAEKKMKQSIWLYRNGYISSKTYSSKITGIFATLDKGNAYGFKMRLVNLQFKK